MIGPLPEWHSLPSAHRICRASTRLMRLIRQLTAWGLSRPETVLALQSVIDALDSARHGGKS